MRAMKKYAAMVMMMALAPLARGQVMDLLPADAGVVVKVNKVSQLNTKLAKLMNDWGLVQFKPELADPLEDILNKAGMKNGFNKDGDLAIALIIQEPKAGKAKADANAPKANGEGAAPAAPARARRGMPEPKALLLIPVTNYEQFLGNFQGAQTENGISTVQFPNNPKPHYMVHWGNYAAVSNNKDEVTQKPAGLNVTSAPVNNELQSKDLVLYVNVPQVRSLAKKGIAGFQQRLQQQMKAANPAGAEFKNLAQTTITQELNGIQRILDDADAIALSVNISDAGINFGGVADFKPETYMGKLIGQIQPADDLLLTGLPANKYIAYGGYKLSPALSQAIVDFSVPIMQSMGANGGGQAQLADSVKKLAQATTWANFGIVAPTGALGASSLFQGYMITHGDAKTIAAETKNYFAGMGAALTPPPAPPSTTPAPNGQPANPPPAPTMTVKTEIHENAKQVDGVNFSQYLVQMNINPSNPQEAQAAQALSFLYGPNGLNYYTGIVTNETVLTVFGNETLIQPAVAGVKANQNVLGQKPNVQAVNNSLPKNRFAVGYFAMDQFLTTVTGYAAQFGFPVNLQLPPDLPPIGAALATENGTALRGEIHVSSQMVQSIIAAGLQAWQQMQGGHGPGGPNAQPGAL